MKNSNIVSIECCNKIIEFKLGYFAIKRLRSLHDLSLNDIESLENDVDIEILGKILHSSFRGNIPFQEFEEMIDELTFSQLIKLFKSLMGDSAIKDDDVKDDDKIIEDEIDKKK